MRASVVVPTCRGLLAAAFLLGTPISSLHAQQERVGRGYFQAGLQVLDLDELNARLTANGIPTFENRFVTLGGGGHVEIGRLLLGGEGQGLIEHSETAGNYQRKLAGGMGFFDVGYVLARPERARAYALVGLGGGGINLRTTERTLPSFEDVLDEPRRGSDVAAGGLLGQIALGGDVILRLSETAQQSRGLSLGVRLGYVLAPWMGEWRLNGSEVPGGPEVGVGGPYLRVSIGGGGGRR